MDLTPGQQKLLTFWGNIQSAVAQRASTAVLWATVRAAAAQEGFELKGVSPMDMSRLRGIAAAQRNAMEALMATRPDQTITSRMIASDISSRGPAAQNLAPSFMVRFEHDITVNGVLRTVWRTSVFDQNLPTTVGDLRSAVEKDAEALAADYGTTHVGTGRMAIVAV